MFHICHPVRPTAQLVIRSTVTALALIASSLPTVAAELPPACETPRVLLAQDQVRDGEGGVGETHCYRLDLASAGLLLLDVSVAGSLASGATIDVFRADFSDRDRSAAKSSRPWTLARTAGERLGFAEAGAWYVEVRAEDPRRPLPAYRLASRFLEPTKSETDGEVEIEPEGFVGGPFSYGTATKSETDGEVEIEPEGFVGGPFSYGPATKSETDGEVEIEPEGFAGWPFSYGPAAKSETDGEVEIEPEGIVAGCDRLPALVDFLCRAGGSDDLGDDDHGDTLACATPFERRVEGELDNGWGDDADVFRFEVRRWQTVEITTEGAIDTRGTLFDRHGQRLAADDDGEGESFRVVRTLRPGTYFVRVEGADSDGAYALTVHGLGR